jgi:hypothetical protein
VRDGFQREVGASGNAGTRKGRMGADRVQNDAFVKKLIGCLVCANEAHDAAIRFSYFITPNNGLLQVTQSVKSFMNYPHTRKYAAKECSNNNLRSMALIECVEA